MKTFFAELITPEKSFFRGDIEMLVVETLDGQLGVLANHEPTASALKPGTVKILQNGKWREAFSSGGFIEIRPDETIVLSEAIEWPEDIEESRAKAAIERAERRLRRSKSQKEYTLSKASMARALARLRVKEHYND